MSDGVVPVSAGGAGATETSSLHSAGSMLRKAREAAGLHVAALAVSMKVPVKKLEALEADRLDQLPDMVFVRALASSVCRTLKIDPLPVLEKLPNTNKQQLAPSDRDINAPFDAYGSKAVFSVSAALKKPVVGLVSLLLLAAGAVFFYPGVEKNRPTEPAVTGSVQILSDSAQSIAVVSQEGLVPPANTVGSPDGVSPLPSLQTEDASVPVMAHSSTSKPESVGALNSAALDSVPALEKKTKEDTVTTDSASEFLILKAIAPCWVKVVDSNGIVRVHKVVGAGEKIGVGGVVPLSVVIGAVDAVNVEVRGKPLNILGFAKDNVARFEVR